MHPTPGLRPLSTKLRNKSNTVAKVGIIVQPGAELDVDPDVAAQLASQTSAFEEVSSPPKKAPTRTSTTKD